MRWHRRVIPLVTVVLAFAARVFALDTTYVDGDRANPHGMALLLVHQLSRGEFTDLLLFADNASVGLPNAALMNYLWALISLVDRSLMMPTAFGLIANTLVVALVYLVGRVCFGWTTGVIASTLSAMSNWGVYLARGVWHPGQLEVSVALAAALLTLGIARCSGKLLFWGWVGVLVAAGGYFGAFFTPIPAAVGTLISGAWQRPLRRAWLAGALVCAVGISAFVVALFLTGRFSLQEIGRVSLFAQNERGLTEEELAARDITPFNRNPIGHFFRLASNQDYARVWTAPDVEMFPVREPLSQVVAWLVNAGVALGLLRMLLNGHNPASRLLLAWAALPLAALYLIVALKYDFRVPPYYLLLTSPTMYLAGGYGLAGVVERLRRATPLGLSLLCALLVIPPSWNFVAAATTVYRQPLISPGFMPLRWSLRLGQLWQQECRTINGSNFWWDLSLIQSPERWRPAGARFNELSSIWTFPPEGGTCAIEQAGAPLPNSEVLSLPLEDGSVIRTYRALPYNVRRPISLTVNLGWSLLAFDVPERASPGEILVVRHAWHVDALPNEPHAHWYFAPFVKVFAPDGSLVLDVDRAAALLGAEWRVGEVQVSEVRVPLPASLPVGVYRVQSSLFDPNQKKHAVYFHINDPSTPILFLERTLRVE